LICFDIVTRRAYKFNAVEKVGMENGTLISQTVLKKRQNIAYRFKV